MQSPHDTDDRDDESGTRGPDGETSIRVRTLSKYLAKGATILDARLAESVDGIWSIWVRLDDRPGDLLVKHFHSDEPKTYADVNLAIRVLRVDFGYYGALTLTTDRRPVTA